jgi:hypothetical protein
VKKETIKEKFGKKNKENFAHIKQQNKPSQTKPWASCLSFSSFGEGFSFD